MALTAASTSWLTPCRCASHLGSLYDSHVVPAASCHTSAFNGRSMPIVCIACMSGVPPLALPKIRSWVGRSDIPTSAAPAAWSMRAETVIPFGLTAASSLFIVSFGPWLLAIVINPAAALACTPLATPVSSLLRNDRALTPLGRAGPCRRGIAETPYHPRYIRYIAWPWRCTREWRLHVRRSCRYRTRPDCRTA